jgi:hypothetical protein
LINSFLPPYFVATIDIHLSLTNRILMGLGFLHAVLNVLFIQGDIRVTELQN